MARYSFFVFSRCTDPAREEEFNRWYTHVHLPDLRGARGLVAARRGVNTDPSSPARYVAIYEFETDDIDDSLKSLYELAAGTWPRGRHIDCMVAAPPASGVEAFREIDPASLAPLGDPGYPTEMPEAIRRGFAKS
jgi:hypothetical protein